MKLERAFFNRSVVDVAKDLIGKRLLFNDYSAIITETEAYRGSDDPASHAFRGKTARSAIMFGPPGFSYVYMIYGMYYCLNIVAEDEGQPAAVLIRGAQLEKPYEAIIDGPGRFCKRLGITRDHTALDLVAGPFSVEEAGLDLPVSATARIGITTGTDKLWRFVAGG